MLKKLNQLSYEDNKPLKINSFSIRKSDSNKDYRFTRINLSNDKMINKNGIYKLH